jgi:hypothetical protein
MLKRNTLKSQSRLNGSEIGGNRDNLNPQRNRGGEYESTSRHKKMVMLTLGNTILSMNTEKIKLSQSTFSERTWQRIQERCSPVELA